MLHVIEPGGTTTRCIAALSHALEHLQKLLCAWPDRPYQLDAAQRHADKAMPACRLFGQPAPTISEEPARPARVQQTALGSEGCGG
ncbi:MAG: hypothetical protein HON07_00880 [Planctomycetaceae bacterium]|nr:hypothetical protein [Planctomycetaceae bacterium]